MVCVVCGCVGVEYTGTVCILLDSGAHLITSHHTPRTHITSQHTSRTHSTHHITHHTSHITHHAHTAHHITHHTSHITYHAHTAHHITQYTSHITYHAHTAHHITQYTSHITHHAHTAHHITQYTSHITHHAHTGHTNIMTFLLSTHTLDVNYADQLTQWCPTLLPLSPSLSLTHAHMQTSPTHPATHHPPPPPSSLSLTYTPATASSFLSLSLSHTPTTSSSFLLPLSLKPHTPAPPPPSSLSQATHISTSSSFLSLSSHTHQHLLLPHTHTQDGAPLGCFSRQTQTPHYHTHTHTHAPTYITRTHIARTHRAHISLQGEVGCIQLLIAHEQIDLNVCDLSGYTPLILASIYGHSQVFECVCMCILLLLCV